MIKKGHYHFSGVGGTGMSALARIMLSLGCEVSGSDRYVDTGVQHAVIGALKKKGVKIVPQDGSGVRKDTVRVVYSSAIEADNPDFVSAKKKKVSTMHRATLLADIVADKQCVAVAGTSGKSTVTGMLGFVLEKLGADPAVVNGAPLVDWEGPDEVGNVRISSSDLWVIEVDESDQSLLNFHPEKAIITNCSADHFGEKETREIFDEFTKHVAGTVISTIDDLSILSSFNPSVSKEGSKFNYKNQEFSLGLPGAHNAQNAFLCVLMCVDLGYGLKEISTALADFKGIRRRLEIAGVKDGITVIDDFAHNPQKIRASFEALKPHYRRVLCIWRPHGFGPLITMLSELSTAFSEICESRDQLYILPVYDAGGTANRSVTHEVLVDQLLDLGVDVEPAESFEAVQKRIIANAIDGDVVVVMGARDPGLPELSRNILSAL